MKILAFQPKIYRASNGIEKLSHVFELVEKVDLAIQSSSSDKVDLVALPELTTIEFTKKAFENLSEVAESLDGESFSLFAELAKKHSTYISFSLPRKEQGNFYISNIVINRHGALETYYDKIHIPKFGFPIEKNYFKRGKKTCVFRVNEFQVGVIICYDFRFPEYSRLLVEKFKLDFILHPVAFVEDDTFPSWHNFVITRALENHVYFLSINRAGQSWGNSIFCSPWIDQNTQPVVFGKDEEYKFFELFKDRLHTVKDNYNFSEDRLKSYETLEPEGDISE